MHAMDLNGRSNNNERDSDLGDDSPMSHDDEREDCDSSEEGHPINPQNTNLDYSRRIPGENHDISLSHHPHFPPNHPLGVLNNFMGIPVQNLSDLQNGDVLEKLKMQVRDIKVGLLDQEYPGHSAFNGNLSLPNNNNNGFSLPQTSMGSHHSGQQPENLSQSQNSQQQQQQHTNGFSFTSPNIPNIIKDANPNSNSSSDDASNSSQQNNGWSFEEQFKQVRQLYEINDDPKRKEFLDDLFAFMQKRGTPINRLPIMAKSVLDLYELYNLVIARGGLVDVINKKLWQEIIKGLHLPSSITSAAFTLRTQYMKYLYPYECEKKNLSTPSELQAAIDGNRREGRRSSYGQFEAIQNQLQMPQLQRSPISNGIQQMSPLALVSQPSGHHQLMAPSIGQLPNFTHDIEHRMMEYIKLIQAQNSVQNADMTPRDALNALEMSRVALWTMYHNNNSPPISATTSPPGIEPQREALNLSDSPPNGTIKRERSQEPVVPDRDGDFVHPPPAKREIPQNFHFANNNLQDEVANLGNIQRERTLCEDKYITSSSIPRISPTKQQNDEFSINTGMQFKISRKENCSNGELSVNLELNGIQYEGVLFANPTAITATTSSSSSTSTSTSTSNSTRTTTAAPATVTAPPTKNTSTTSTDTPVDDRTSLNPPN